MKEASRRSINGTARSRLTKACSIVGVWLLGLAMAHQSLLFARVTSQPAIPLALESFELRVQLADTSQQPVGEIDLLALVENRIADSAPKRIDASMLADAEPLRAGPASGDYRLTVPPLPADSYRLTLIEVSGGQSESHAFGTLSVGGSSPIDIQMLLPASGGNGLGTWLVWLIGLPLLAGLLVTILLLTGRTRTDEE